MNWNNISLAEDEKSKPLYGIDIAKFISALLVVAIHIAPFGKGAAMQPYNFIIQRCIARIAVPFFFMASGFLFFRKMITKILI